MNTRNTRISYRYRNSVWDTTLFESVVISGELQLADIKLFFKDGTDFIPSQLDWPALNGKDIEVDVSWHKILDVILTDDQPTIEMTARALIQKLKTIQQDGWKETLLLEEIVQQVAAAVNGFFLREPKELSHLTNFIVRLESDEFGSEDFKNFNLQSAIEQIIRLYLKVIKTGDNFERRIGLVVTPQIQLADYSSEERGIVNPPTAQPLKVADDVLTIYRERVGGQSCQAQRQDFVWVCNDLGVGDLDVLEESKTNSYVFNDTVNYDLVSSSLKQKEMLVYKEDKK